MRIYPIAIVNNVCKLIYREITKKYKPKLVALANTIRMLSFYNYTIMFFMLIAIIFSVFASTITRTIIISSIVLFFGGILLFYIKYKMAKVALQGKQYFKQGMDELEKNCFNGVAIAYILDESKEQDFVKSFKLYPILDVLNKLKEEGQTDIIQKEDGVYVKDYTNVYRKVPVIESLDEINEMDFSFTNSVVDGLFDYLTELQNENKEAKNTSLQ